MQALPPVGPTTLPLPAAGGLRVTLDSPLRLTRQARLVSPAAFTFGELFRPLLRRISMLSYFHAERPLDIDFRQLGDAADRVELIAPQLRWQEQTRYSSRQRTRLEIGGLQGTFGLYSDRLEAFWPYLWLGQWLGVGKGTVMGQGQYRPSIVKNRTIKCQMSLGIGWRCCLMAVRRHRPVYLTDIHGILITFVAAPFGEAAG